jgi:hypothetical protein
MEIAYGSRTHELIRRQPAGKTGNRNGHLVAASVPYCKPKEWAVGSCGRAVGTQSRLMVSAQSHFAACTIQPGWFSIDS